MSSGVSHVTNGLASDYSGSDHVTDYTWNGLC